MSQLNETTEKMSQLNEFIHLKNAMNSKIDLTVISYALLTLFGFKSKSMLINIQHIISITHGYTDYDKNSYYLITLINGEKIYVNSSRIVSTGFFKVHLTTNDDYNLIKAQTKKVNKY
jgi:hypothetical protein